MQQLARYGLLHIVGSVALLTAAMTSPAQGQSGTVRNVSCSGDITSALNSAIGSSANGDTVQISSGSCSTSRVTLTNKNITILGAGKSATTITANSGFAYINVTGSIVPSFRISSLTLTGTGNSVAIQVWAVESTTLRGPFRIDNISFSYPGTHVDGLLAFWGPIYGLVDHNDFTDAGITIITGMEVNTETCSYNFAWQGGGCSLSTLAGGAAAALPYEPGSPRNLYIESNTFTNAGSSGGAAIDTAYSGGRVVFRNNILQNSMLYAHWTTGNAVNTLWWEIYGNKMNWTLGLGMYAMRLHGGGTGLIYNNSITGFPGNYVLIGDGRLPDQNQTGSPLTTCEGSRAWDGNLGDSSAPGWPCLAQIGRNAGKSIAQIQAGDKQASFPLYIWNNGPQTKCSDSSAAGASCDNSFNINIYNSNSNFFRSTPHPNGDVDWSKTAAKPTGAGTHTLSYTPFTFPYPLTTSGLPDSSAPPTTGRPSPPSNLRVGQ